MAKLKLPDYEYPFSTNVLCYRYVPWAQTLMIRFRSDASAEFWYLAVPPRVYESFHEAESKGRWVWENLRAEWNGGRAPYRWEKYSGLKGVSRP